MDGQQNGKFWQVVLWAFWVGIGFTWGSGIAKWVAALISNAFARLASG